MESLAKDAPRSARRPIAVLGAPSSIGIRPYDDGGMRRLDLAPRTLRELGIVERLGAEDRGDVLPPPYVDFVRPDGGVRNQAGVAKYSMELATAVAGGLRDDRFVVVLGGDCSIVLGTLLGARALGRVGLAYVDGHADFATPAESTTGSAASMCLALAVGRGDSVLARLGGDALVRGEDVVLVGRRDEGDPFDHAALSAYGILDVPDAERSARTAAEIAASALERLARAELDGFWVHLDADVIDPVLMPAVDSPEPGGPEPAWLSELLEPLVTHPYALGLQVTIYDPALDPARTAGRRLVGLLEGLLAARGSVVDS